MCNKWAIRYHGEKIDKNNWDYETQSSDAHTHTHRQRSRQTIGRDHRKNTKVIEVQKLKSEPKAEISKYHQRARAHGEHKARETHEEEEEWIETRQKD